MTEIVVKTLLMVALGLALWAYRTGFFQRAKESGGLIAKLQQRRDQQKAGLKESSVAVGSQEIAYLDGGSSNTTILLLHGFGCDKEVWMDFASQLVDKKLRVVIPDLPGFGANEKDANVKYSASRLTKMIRQFSRELGLQRFHIVGHSIGALVAASYAYASPLEIESLALFEPLGLRVPYETDLDKQLTQGRNPLITNTVSGYEAVLRYMTQKPPTLTPRELKLHGDRVAGRAGFYQQVWKDLREGDRANLLDLLLPELKVKTLVLVGERSRVVHESTPEVAKRALRQTAVRTATIPQTGHLPMLERPDATAEIYLQFLTGR